MRLAWKWELIGVLPILERRGALFGDRTEILRFPRERFTVRVCNLSSANPSDLSRKVADIYFEKKLPSLAAPARSATQGTATRHIRM
jgi:hypothetical protein